VIGSVIVVWQRAAIGGALAGRYELGTVLGSGGYATVYRARDLDADREVAVKVIPTALASGEGIDPQAGEDEDAQFDRFRQEALALSRLRSRHIARVYDFGRDAAVGLYLVMELIEGVPLDVRSLGRPLLPHEVLRVARGLLTGLAEAHAHGISHRDIKPSNLLVPRGGRGLDEPRILDFGIARDERRASVLSEALGRSEYGPGMTLGTPAFMAPEQLRDGVSTPASDVYSAGLVLFDLLGMGLLFSNETVQGQVGARLLAEASLEGRVAQPLGSLLATMLQRDPARRFRDAGEALEAIGDLETAPVSLGALDGEGATVPSPVRLAPDAATKDGTPSNRPSPVTPPPASSGSHVPPDRGSARPHVQARSDAPPHASSPPSRPVPGLAYGAKRLSRLARDPLAALVETLHALDLAMLDALARREARATGATVARVARAVALALRLELDAAALILEPLGSQSDLARAFGATLIAPRARRATRARVDTDKGDPWVDTVDAELAAMLCALATAMTVRDDAARNEQRCRRVVERAAAGSAVTGPTMTTLRMAQVAAGMIAGTTAPSSALTDVLRLRDADRDATSPFLGLVRALLLGLVGFRADEHLAREQLERATKIAAESGNTLFETRAIVAWGGMLVEIPERVDQGLNVLERATTLLAHGDAPSLEHIAEHNRGAALVIQGRYSEAAPHLRRARSAAKGELSLEHEILSCMNEGLSHVALGDRDAAARIVDELSDARINQCSARTAAYCHAVRSMFSMLFETPARAAAELRRAHTRAAEAEAEGADAYLLAEALGILYATARHEDIDLLARAGELQKLAQDRGFVSFYWFEVLRAMVSRIRDEEERAHLGETLEKLVVLLGPAQMARG
jgi:serine/threonine-protein kinase